MYNELTVSALYNLENTLAADYLRGFTYPWEALAGIKDFINKLGPTLPADEYDSPKPGVWIHKTATVAPTAFIGDGVIICEGAEIRHCAFIRGSALIGKHATVGNSTELKNVILFDRAQAPHYNYVGDSILGFKSHMGAGSITSNLKSDSSLTAVRVGNDKVETGLKKFGAMLGDNVEVGCGSVLNPATVVGPHTNIYPLSMVRGFVPGGSIYKNKNEVVAKV